MLLLLSDAELVFRCACARRPFLRGGVGDLLMLRDGLRPRAGRFVRFGCGGDAEREEERAGRLRYGGGDRDGVADREMDRARPGRYVSPFVDFDLAGGEREREELWRRAIALRRGGEREMELREIDLVGLRPRRAFCGRLPRLGGEAE